MVSPLETLLSGFSSLHNTLRTEAKYRQLSFAIPFACKRSTHQKLLGCKYRLVFAKEICGQIMHVQFISINLLPGIIIEMYITLTAKPVCVIIDY